MYFRHETDASDIGSDKTASMAFEFLQPVPEVLRKRFAGLSPGQLGKESVFYAGSEPDTSGFRFALIGVCEDRGNSQNAGSREAPDAVREMLYPLYMPAISNTHPLLDMGNILPGESKRDTYAALSEVLRFCMMQHLIPIVIGGSHDLTFAQYKAYESFDMPINLAVADECINMDEGPEDEPDAKTFLSPILLARPNLLFNLCHLGHQTYLNHPAKAETLESLNFDCIRLGQIRAALQEAEPLLRDADLLSFDIAAIRMADAPATAQASPNGFAGEEFCQLMRYAGLSERLQSVGIYEYNPHYDHGQQTAQLIAQGIWYFMEGAQLRKAEKPDEDNERDYYKFIVKMEMPDHELVFWKSRISERWWMEFPYSLMHKKSRNHLVPCSLRDYQMACREEIPDRWMRIYNKLL